MTEAADIHYYPVLEENINKIKNGLQRVLRPVRGSAGVNHPPYDCILTHAYLGT